MGITQTQIEAAVVARLHHYHRAIVRYAGWNRPPTSQRADYDAACWAFAAMLDQSPELEALVCRVSWAFEHAEVEPEPDTQLGLDVLDMVITAYAALRHDADQATELDAPAALREAIVGWSPRGYEGAVLYYEADHPTYSPLHDFEGTWLGGSTDQRRALLQAARKNRGNRLRRS